MAIEIATYSFEGPITFLEEIKEGRGIFCVLCIIPNGKIFPIDIGESEKVRSAVENSEKRDCWGKNCKGTIAVAVLYTPDQDKKGRSEIVKCIRDWDYIPCAQA